MLSNKTPKERKLTILHPVYVIESPVETEEVSFQIALPLPLGQNKDGNGIAIVSVGQPVSAMAAAERNQKPARYV